MKAPPRVLHSIPYSDIQNKFLTIVINLIEEDAFWGPKRFRGRRTPSYVIPKANQVKTDIIYPPYLFGLLTNYPNYSIEKKKTLCLIVLFRIARTAAIIIHPRSTPTLRQRWFLAGTANYYEIMINPLPRAQGTPDKTLTIINIACVE